MPVTEAVIRSLATAQSFERGESYYHGGAVLGLNRRGNTLLAQVEGSGYEPYEVTVELSEHGVVEAYCTCPYDWGGCCKHIVASLLAYVREPDEVSERPPVSELLGDLERGELLDLLTELLAEHPRLVDWVEMRLATQVAESSGEDAIQPRQRQGPIDPEPFRKRALHIMSSLSHMRPSEAYWHTGDMAHNIQDLIDQARPFIEAGDGLSALLILEAVTQVYVDRWLEYDDSDGYLGDLFADFGQLFAEAILSADLSPEERDEWADKLTGWQAEVEDYGIDEAFDVAIAAAVLGWDFAPLQAALAGQVTDSGAWEDEVPWYADELALARLNVLERQGRTAEYLYLAEAEDQTVLYLTMLVKLGRIEEALEYAMRNMATADEALALAQALREHDRPEEALRMAEHGLTLHGETQTLARWTRDFAAGAGRPALALRAARAAFAASHSLENYQAAQALAGEDWPSVKTELLDLLAADEHAVYNVDIYLYEGMVDEAVRAVDSEAYATYYAVERVVDAAWQSHPDWTIRHCRSQAEPIMDDGRSNHYHHAVRWLGKARRAYLGAGREDEWRDYLEGLIAKHTRKYSLRPQLEALRKSAPQEETGT